MDVKDSHIRMRQGRVLAVFPKRVGKHFTPVKPHHGPDCSWIPRAEKEQYETFYNRCRVQIVSNFL